MRTTTRLLALLTPALMGAGAHCGPEEPDRPCPSTYGEIGPDSPWFDARDVRPVEWVLKGSWIYSAGYGHPENTGFTLELRWNGEHYDGYRYECADGTRTATATSIPIDAHLRTDDGAFQEVLSATAHVFPSGKVVYEFFDTPDAELVGTFQLPERATDGKECSSPYFEFLDLQLGRQQVEIIGLHSPGYAWMAWRCDPTAYPIGRPEFAGVKQLGP